MNKALLLIVDVQNGFVCNPQTEAIIPCINKLIDAAGARNWQVVYSRFINQPDSPWVRLMNYQGVMNGPDTELNPELKVAGKVFDKTKYSAWSEELTQRCIAEDIRSVTIVGIDTDQCVLATALDVFDHGLRPIIVTDCCASSADETFHEAGLKLMKRLFGEKQMLTSEELP